MKMNLKDTFKLGMKSVADVLHSFSRGIIASAVVIALLPVVCSAETYRINSNAAFRAIQNKTLNAGDRVLFQRGRTFNGQVILTGEGTRSNRIIVSAYGSGRAPIINGNGKTAALRYNNPHWVEIGNLEVTNTTGSNGDQGNLFGILAYWKTNSSSRSTFEHVYILNCFVHDVNGRVAGKGRGGIHAIMEGSKAAIVNDLHINNNTLEDIGGVGIANISDFGDVNIKSSGHDEVNLWRNVLMSGNTIDYTGRNAIIVRDSKNPIVQFNRVSRSSRHDTGNSIFNFDTVGCVMQYNEVSGNTGSGADRGGYDADFNAVNTFIQYNYSHDNEWFCSIMKRPNRNVTIRYNVSQNEGKGFYFYGFDSDSRCENVRIYNNTHYARAGRVNRVFVNGRSPHDTTLENNIFYFADEDDARYGTGNLRGATFNNNIYFNIDPHSSDSRAITSDPRLSDPGTAGTNINLFTGVALNGYRLLSGSPAINAGLGISNNGGEDILGNSVSRNSTDIGAFEGSVSTPGVRFVQIRKRNRNNFVLNGGSGAVKGRAVTLFEYRDNHINLTWEEIDRGNGFFSYQKKGTNLSLDGGSSGRNNQLVRLQTTSSSNQNQQWKKVSKGNGFFQLQKRNARGFALNGGSGGANGQNVSIYNSSSSSQNLQWSFEYK